MPVSCRVLKGFWQSAVAHADTGARAQAGTRLGRTNDWYVHLETHNFQELEAVNVCTAAQ